MVVALWKALLVMKRDVERRGREEEEEDGSILSVCRLEERGGRESRASDKRAGEERGSSASW